MIRGPFFLMVLLAGGRLMAASADSCSALYQQKIQVELHESLVHSKITKEEVKNMISGLNSLVGPELSASELSVVVAKLPPPALSKHRILGFYYQPVEGHPAAITLHLDPEMRAQDVAAPLAHEYGHDVFFRFLFTPLEKILSRANNPDATTGFLEDLFAGNQSTHLYYNEMFADLVAALYTGDGQALSKSLFIESGDSFKKYYQKNTTSARPRSLTEVVDFSSWKIEEGGKQNYTNLEPAGRTLWQLIQKRKIPKSKYSALLRAYLLAVKDHVQMRIETTPDFKNVAQPLSNENLASINQEFLGLIIQQMRQQGAW